MSESHARGEDADRAVGAAPQNTTAAVESSADQDTSPAETALIGYLRQLADQVDPASRPVREGWAYPSPHHLLLDLGRLFTPAPLPPDMDQLSEGACYANAARTIAEHPGRSLVYVEGYGTCLTPGYLHTPHGWATSGAAPVAAPATAIDPT
jgi:hypothetical protein